MRVTGKAHGIQRYDNTLGVDGETSLPVHILVEEGKHASCTDRNADGHYTPGFDVTERVNDAWGVRDTLGTGTFFTGHYQSWMTKMRGREHAGVSSAAGRQPAAGGEQSGRAVRSGQRRVRPATLSAAGIGAPDLKPYIADKGDPSWPQLVADTYSERFETWLRDESFAKSWAWSFRWTGISACRWPSHC